MPRTEIDGIDIVILCITLAILRNRLIMNIKHKRFSAWITSRGFVYCPKIMTIESSLCIQSIMISSIFNLLLAAGDSAGYPTGSSATM